MVIQNHTENFKTFFVNSVLIILILASQQLADLAKEIEQSDANVYDTLGDFTLKMNKNLKNLLNLLKENKLK